MSVDVCYLLPLKLTAKSVHYLVEFNQRLQRKLKKIVITLETYYLYYSSIKYYTFLLNQSIFLKRTHQNLLRCLKYLKIYRDR